MIGNLYYVFESLLFIRFLTAENTLTSSCKCAFSALVVDSLSSNSFICCLSALLSSASDNFCVIREKKMYFTFTCVLSCANPLHVYQLCMQGGNYHLWVRMPWVALFLGPFEKGPGIHSSCMCLISM